MKDYLNKLNEQQREAVEYIDGPSLVIAGAGSGKTRVLTYKIVHLIEQGYTPYRIMALTFTNKAAREMKERIYPLVGQGTASQLWMGTFHSIFSRILRINSEKIGFKHDFTIYDTSDSKSLIKTIIKDMQLDDKIYKPSAIQSHISNLKNALISPHDYEINRGLRYSDEKAGKPMVYAIYNAYWHRCFLSNAMDFDDLLFYTNILLRDNPEIAQKYQDFFQFILVDEYQDTNFAQHMIILMLTKTQNNLCVVGDDAQSIYSFRGANISNILNLKNIYPNLKTFKLERNYRSTQNIISAANSLIEKNKQQIRKHIYSENAKGGKIPVIQAYSDYEESYVVANKIIEIKSREGDTYEDFAVLYRTNAQSRVLEEALRKRNIPYRIYGGLSFYQRKEIKDAISYFRMSINPNDDEALRRIINKPARGIGETTLSKVQHNAIKNNVSLWAIISEPQKYDLNVNSGTLKKLSEFHSLISSFIKLNETDDAYSVANTIIERSQLLSVLSNELTPENISAQENINELISGINAFVDSKTEEGSDDIKLTDFLAEVSLATDQDTDTSTDDCVTLMTVHAAKGLEFKNVIVVGVEENLFPSSMSMDSLSAIEEERRLLYVAITRAKTNCILTFTTSRFRNGSTQSCTMSRFIHDIDERYLQVSQTSAAIGEKVHTNSSFNRNVYDIFKSHTELNNSANNYDTKRLVPIAKAKQRPTNSATSNSEYSLHSADELNEGNLICHSRFGNGTITMVDTSGSDSKITVDFGDIGTRSLLLKFAKFKILK